MKKLDPNPKVSPNDPDFAAAAISIRQLILNGKYKTALDRARDIHKAHPTPASEALLIEAYAARIEGLMRQNLTQEADSLLALVRERYPAAAPRLAGLTASNMARAGKLNELLMPLADPDLPPERRTAIESAVQEHVRDLAALAACPALAAEHPLRQAAAALAKAFDAVTTGPVSDEALALPEVSRRSPLAPWKMLVSAIAAFYRHEDDACRKYLDAITPESAPARLIPAIQALLDGKPAKSLPSAGAALVAGIAGNGAALKHAIDQLDREFAANENDNRILNTIRTATAECRQSAPDRLVRLKQHISVRAALLQIDDKQILGAMGGPALHDAYFHRLFARGMEASDDLQERVMACEIWNLFRVAAVEEGLFAPNGPEAAALYLHMAKLLRDVPERMVRSFEEFRRAEKTPGDDLFYVHAETLYERACVLDPRSEAFTQWMEWAKRSDSARSEKVAEVWQRVLPRDLEPVLHLMHALEKRGAFSKALEYLAKAERIDGLNPEVRKARLRLMAGDAMRQIRAKKPALAEKALDEIAALPQARQGDRPAFFAALRSIAASANGNNQRADAFRDQAGLLLGSRLAVSLLIGSLAVECKRGGFEKPVTLKSLSAAERAALPADLARLKALARDVEFSLDTPQNFVAETARQFASVSASLDPDRLRMLGELALESNHLDLAYAVSAAGLARGNEIAAGFLLLRARSIPDKAFERRMVCAAAAAGLAQRQRDVDLTAQSVEFLRGPFRNGAIELSPAQVDEVLAKERTEPVYRLRRGPKYRSIVGDRCDCPDCRRERGEAVDDFEFPPDMPRGIAAMLLEETARAIENGESLEDLLDRLGNGPVPRFDRSTKGRRR